MLAPFHLIWGEKNGDPKACTQSETPAKKIVQSWTSPETFYQGPSFDAFQLLAVFFSSFLKFT
jgi:hypothetical protein